MADANLPQQRIALTVILIAMGGLVVWFAGIGPYLGAVEENARKIVKINRDIRTAKKTKARIAGRRRQLALLDGQALHMAPAEADQHCQKLLYKWAAAGNIEDALVRNLRPSRLTRVRTQRSYCLTGTTTLDGVRGLLYAMRIDPTDHGVRRMRRIETIPLNARSPEKLRVSLNVGWLFSETRGIAPSTRPKPAATPMTRYDAMVDRAMFVPYSPPRNIAVAPTTPGPRDTRPHNPRPRKERWQLSLVANAGVGPEAEFLSERNLKIKRISVGARFAGYRVHEIDLTKKSVIFRQGDLLFEVILGKFFSERKMIGKYQPPDEVDKEGGP